MKVFYENDEEFKKDNEKLRHEVIKSQQKTSKSINKKRNIIRITILTCLILYVFIKIAFGSIHISFFLIDFATPYNRSNLYDIKINDNLVGVDVNNTRSITLIPTLIYLDNHNSTSYYQISSNNEILNSDKYILNVTAKTCYSYNTNTETLCELTKDMELESNMYSKLNTNIKYQTLSITNTKNHEVIYKGNFIKDITPYIKKNSEYEINIKANYKNVTANLTTIIKTTNKKEEDKNMNKIKMLVDNTSYEIFLEDNETAKDFLNLLPISINMQDLNNTEKYSYLNNPLNINSTTYTGAKKGDLMLYQDNCLVLFYKDYNANYSYHKIGTIKNLSDLEKITDNTTISIKFMIS